MQFQWQALIDRARVYVNDDHKDNGGWIAPDKWLTLAQVEYANLYRKWVRMGLVRPAPKDTTFTNAATTIQGVLAIVGVAEDLGSYVRLLSDAQPGSGADAFWFGSTPFTSKAVSWQAHGSADDLLVEVYPKDTTTTYTVRWVPVVPYTKDPTATIDLPYGGDERLVLGMARRALIKESARSQALDELIREADAELAFEAFGRAGGGPKVRRQPRQLRTYASRFSSFPTDQRFWMYF